MYSLRSTEKLLNYGMHPMSDESGVPTHFLLDTVGNSSSNSDSGSGSNNLPRNNMLYQSQRTSLFDEFVDQTQTNFSQSEFDKSISLLEFTLQT